MLYEFALTVGLFDRFPPAVEAVTNQSLVQVLHGLLRNGVLASLYNGAWWAEVQRKRGTIHPRIQPLTMDLLTRLFDRGLVVPRTKEAATCPRNDADWLDEAIASHGRQNLYGIIAKKASVDSRPARPACAIGLEEVLLAPFWNDRRQSRRVPRTTAGFEAALAPVLATARSVTLIDPQIAFRVYRGNVEFLDMLSVVDRCATPDNRRCPLSLVEIHTLDAPEIATADYPRVIRAIQGAMPRTCASAATRIFRAWQAKPNGPPFHNRRILTNQTAISCPWGLDIHERPGHAVGEDEWALLDDDVRGAIWRDFQQNTSPYDLRQNIPW